MITAKRAYKLSQKHFLRQHTSSSSTCHSHTPSNPSQPTCNPSQPSQHSTYNEAYNTPIPQRVYYNHMHKSHKNERTAVRRLIRVINKELRLAIKRGHTSFHIGLPSTFTIYQSFKIKNYYTKLNYKLLIKKLSDYTNAYIILITYDFK